MITRLKYILQRRKFLQRELNIEKDFEIWEETCVPSYAHPNLLAAWTSWSRLFAAVGMAKPWISDKSSVLDFGAGIAELNYLLPEGTRYHYIEELDSSAEWIARHHADAIRKELDDTGDKYDVIFALDSLEHNDDYQYLVRALSLSLKPGGILIVSGPTENWLYRLGRRIAGFTGHYHKTTIHDINAFIDSELSLTRRKQVPFAIPLFVLSAWSNK